METVPSQVRSGPGDPEGVVIAPLGSIYLRQDGASGTSLYIKESGNGNTGWTSFGNGPSGGFTISAPITPTYLGTTPTADQIGYQKFNFSQISATTDFANMAWFDVTPGVWMIQMSYRMHSSVTDNTFYGSISTTSGEFNEACCTGGINLAPLNYIRGNICGCFRLDVPTTIYFVGRCLLTATFNNKMYFFYATRIA